MERALVYGIRTSETLAEITVRGAPHRPGEVARVFRAIADAGVDIGAVAQVLTAGCVDLAFTVAVRHGPVVVAIMGDIGHERVRCTRVMEVMLVGAGMRGDPTVPALFGEALARAGVRMGLVSIEGDRVSVVCPLSRRGDAVRALCEAFEVDVLVPDRVWPRGG